MISEKDKSQMMQFHNGIEGFNYDLAVDWAIELINRLIYLVIILILLVY